MLPYLHILARLLHLANRSDLLIKGEEFYAIKGKILSKHGKLVGYDLQHIPGKRCYTCGGTGIYVGYYYSGEKWHDTCNRCWHGWYKEPVYVLLERKQFGSYTFHKPFRRWHSTKSREDFIEDLQWQVDYPIAENVIEGYIEHSSTKACDIALMFLFLLYNPKYWWINWKKGIGAGWRFKWYYPSNWIYTVAHFIRHGRKSYPFRKWKERRTKRVNRISVNHIDDLPF